MQVKGEHWVGHIDECFDAAKIKGDNYQCRTILPCNGSLIN